MITNGSITYYHKTLDNNKLPVWNRYVFENVWHFGGKGSNINKGYENANDVNIRIPIEYVDNKDLFTIGDIIAIGIQPNIEKQSDFKFFCLTIKLWKEFYNVTSITINEYGNNPHVHLGGK